MNKGKDRLRLLRYEKPKLKYWMGRAWKRLWSLQEGIPGLEWPALLCLGCLVALAVVPLPWDYYTGPRAAGMALLTAMMMRVVYRVWFRSPPLAMNRPRLRDLIFLAGILVLTAFVAKGYLLFSQSVSSGWLGGVAGVLAFAAPVGMAPLLVSLFLGPQTALLMALCSGFAASLVWNDHTGMFVYFMLTGMMSVRFARSGRNRAALIKAGLRSSFTGMAVVFALGLFWGWYWSWDMLAAVPVVLAGGMMAGVLAAGLSPLVEMAFNYTSSIRLMELGSLDHPVLRRLMLEAPGTYHHSLVTSSLVEAAAKEIGANHLLAKVAALYHDIGKLKKAGYFIENQAGGKNPHEKLAPSMSALILTSHLKEGVEMARKYRLGKPIVDIMAQHHGTRCISYFYSKALECRRQSGQPEPDAQNYCYPGPKPQTREAGLVMLADIAEAACRSLDNPNATRIQKLVSTQINQVFAEGQLDECELTLKDLHKIAKIFNTMLTGICHHRVEYPADVDRGNKRNGDTDRQSAKGAGAGNSGTPRKDPPNLSRLGMR